MKSSKEGNRLQYQKYDDFDNASHYMHKGGERGDTCQERGILALSLYV